MICIHVYIYRHYRYYRYYDMDIIDIIDTIDIIDIVDIIYRCIYPSELDWSLPFGNRTSEHRHVLFVCNWNI